ncbi:hypothetical protein PSTT_11506 [Puccinia striiformis]|uniref:Uncharacterized protein n=2 Tax=Puccinia striiformis TaxID=27350 RepID=A0A2S4V016_9BASI|nr:hypothetical protein PSTT_11506 [Puccinia striiformis]
MDAVIEGFEALRIKHDSRLGDHRLASIASEPAQEATSAMSLDAFNWRNVLYDRLHSCLLPLLRHQLITLSTLLEPEGLQSDPELKLKPILELQPELDQNIFQIKYALAISLVSVMRPISSSKKIMLSALEIISNPDDMPAHDESTIGLNTMDWIDATIRIQKGSELDVAEVHWQCIIPWMFRIRRRLVSCITPATDSIQDTVDHEDVKFTHEPVIQLTKSFILIVQLSRLFYQKISTGGIKRRHLPLSTDMNSQQFSALCQSAEIISTGFSGICQILSEADTAANDGINGHDLVIIVTTLCSLFEDTSPLVVRYLVPLIPETDGLPDQDYYKSWFATWDTQITLAIDNFMHVFHEFFPTIEAV